jgi:hypothetical protein
MCCCHQNVFSLSGATELRARKHRVIPAFIPTQVLKAMNQDGDQVVKEQLMAPPEGKKLLYAKHIAKQRVGLTS